MFDWFAILLRWTSRARSSSRAVGAPGPGVVWRSAGCVHTLNAAAPGSTYARDWGVRRRRGRGAAGRRRPVAGRAAGRCTTGSSTSPRPRPTPTARTSPLPPPSTPRRGRAEGAHPPHYDPGAGPRPFVTGWGCCYLPRRPRQRRLARRPRSAGVASQDTMVAIPPSFGDPRRLCPADREVAASRSRSRWDTADLGGPLGGLVPAHLGARRTQGRPCRTHGSRSQFDPRGVF